MRLQRRHDPEQGPHLRGAVHGMRDMGRQLSRKHALVALASEG